MTAGDLTGRTIWNQYFADNALERSTLLILDPTRYRHRTTESAEILDESVRRCVRLELFSGAGPHLVPIASPKRDHLIDLITISPSAEVTPMILVRRDVALFAKLVLERRARTIGVDLTGDDVQVVTSVASLQPDATRALRSLLDKLSEIEPESTAERTVTQSSPALLELARDEVFMKLFRWFRGTSPLLVPCNPGGEAFVLAFETRSGMREVETRALPRSFRSFVGLTTYDLEFPARSALFTQSYHFQYRAPLGHYVRSCRVFGSRVDVTRTGQRIKDYAKKPYAPVPPAFASYADSDVDGFAHIQIGDARLDTDRPRSITIRVRVSERPLGQLFAAIVRWAVVLGVILFVNALGPRLVKSQITVGASLLLALPGVIGISSLLLSPVEATRIRPIGPRVASFIAGIASLFAAAEFIRWALDYSDCMRRDSLTSIATNVADRQCTTAAAAETNSVFELIVYCGSIIFAVLIVLFGVNLLRYLHAERSRPRRHTYLQRAEGA